MQHSFATFQKGPMGEYLLALAPFKSKSIPDPENHTHVCDGGLRNS